jgi:ribosomal protein L29
MTVRELKIKLMEKRLEIKSGQEKNTNSHKPFRKQIAQLLTRGTVSRVTAIK